MDSLAGHKKYSSIWPQPTLLSLWLPEPPAVPLHRLSPLLEFLFSHFSTWHNFTTWLNNELLQETYPDPSQGWFNYRISVLLQGQERISIIMFMILCYFIHFLTVRLSLLKARIIFHFYLFQYLSCSHYANNCFS